MYRLWLAASAGVINRMSGVLLFDLSLFLPKPNNPTPNPKTKPKTKTALRPNPKHNQIQYQTQSQTQKQTQMFLARGTATVKVFYYAYRRFSAMPLLAYVALQCTQWWSRSMRKAKSFQVCTNTHWLSARTNLFQRPTVIDCNKGICHICRLGICNPCPETERINAFPCLFRLPLRLTNHIPDPPQCIQVTTKDHKSLLPCSSSSNEQRGRLPA